MTDKLKEFDEQLKELLSERFPSTVEVFQLGVAVGRELQLNNINDYVMPSLIQKQKADNKWEETLAFNARIEKCLKQLTVLCIASFINEFNGRSFEVEKGYSYGECDRWSDEIAEQFGVSYSHANMDQYGGEFELSLNTVGWLKELNEKYGLPTEFKATLSNSSGEEYEYIGSREDAESSIYSVSTMNNYVFREMDSQQIESYINELEQQMVFFALKYS